MTEQTKLFILGLGAQKAGTSWLYSQLVRQPYASLGIKEYHVLDALHIPECRHFRVARREAILAYVGSLRGRKKAETTLLRYRMQKDIHTYLDHFEEKFRNEGTSLVGDLTPSHSGLGIDALARVRDEFGRRNVKVKTLFLMRDPVERCWSSVRMKQRKQGSTGRSGKSAAPVTTGPSEQEALGAYYSSSQAIFRTAYEKMAGRLTEVFPQEDIFLGLYEKMTSAEEVDRLEAFIGHRLQDVRSDYLVNVSPKSDLLDPTLSRKIAEFYAPTYDFARRTFGTSVIDAEWPSSVYV